MGQVALGFRSLFIKGAIFFVMAVLLAWALGGTLWPRAESADLPASMFGGESWHWRIVVGGREEGALHWMFMRRGADDDASRVFDETHWKRAAGPVVTKDAIYYAGSNTLEDSGTWKLMRIAPQAAGEWDRTVVELPDRLAIEQEFARRLAGRDRMAEEDADPNPARGLNPEGSAADNGGQSVIPPE